jgi:NADPH-dependent ferric siderophore reductase
MDSYILDTIKRKAGKLFEHNTLQTGRVLEVRHWEPATIIEIDLHLPFADMLQWGEIPYIKFKVNELTYRDYTPSCWDAETRTCSIFVDAAHEGPGSAWAGQLRAGEQVSYIKIGSSHQASVSTSAIVGLGDETSIGHLLALQQTVLPSARFSGAIVVANGQHRSQFSEYFHSTIHTIPRDDVYGHHSLIRWVMNQQYALENVAFYLTGNELMVTELRKLLRHQGYSSDQIRVKGFWS